MMPTPLQTFAQIAIGRILNSLPEGLLMALFVWTMLRLLPRQNSGTRFAVWFVALLAVAALPVAGLPLIGCSLGGHTLAPVEAAQPLITIPGAWGILLFFVWVLAVSVGLLRLANGLWRLRGLRRSCVATDPTQLDPAVQKMVADFASSRSVTLVASESVNVPAAIGFFKPMIVIPAWALRELPPEELKIILLHEFAHLRRWDDWTNLLQKVVRAVFLFHPAVWWIDSRLALEREMACDDEVLADTANPQGYAKCLIGLLEKRFARRGWTMAQAAVHRAGEASLRLAQILDTGRPHARHVWKPALGIVAAFSLVCLVAVPRVPEFVAFDRHMPAVVGSDIRAATFSQPRFPAAVVIPAALRTGPSASIERKPRALSGQVAPRLNKHQLAEHAVPPGIDANIGENNRSPADVVAVRANETVVPVETLLVVRTMQRVGPNAWVWSVSTWHITWVNFEQDGAGAAPIPKKT
jgi:beta-lactamase regulating signal transducer with metallopeptidase domain